jgi:NodT family efflux transporter outer membrane factor (OMF) lipoprotein
MVRPRSWVLPLALVLAAAVALAGCAVGPNYKRPPLPPTAGYGPLAAAPGGPALVAGADVPGDWWRVFKSDDLDALVGQALANNQTITAARAALKAAHEQTLAQKGFYYPTVAASIQPSRAQFAPDLASPTESGVSLYTLTTSQLTVSYTPDLFGANRRAVESLAAQEDAQRFELEAARVTIATNVVAAAVQDASLRAQIDATKAIIAEQQRVLDSFRRQLLLGNASAADVAAQEALLAQSEAALPPLQRQFEAGRDLLADLVGRTPAQPVLDSFSLDALTLPGALPISVPARLVDQRPDVRMAEAQLHSASAQIGVAVAARLPNLDIEAAAGSATLDLGLSLSSAATFWSVAGTLVQPIFEGGTLLHRQHAAEALYDQAKAQYESTVVGAFQNTADALHALKTDADAVAAADRAEAAATRSLQIATRQHALGDISAVALLTAEQAEAQARIGLVQAKAARYADVAGLFQALGGGWWAAPSSQPAAGS